MIKGTIFTHDYEYSFVIYIEALNEPRQHLNKIIHEDATVSKTEQCILHEIAFIYTIVCCRHEWLQKLLVKELFIKKTS